MPEITAVQGYGPRKDGGFTYTVHIKVEAPLQETFLLRLEEWLAQPEPPAVSVQQDGVLRPMRHWFQRMEVGGMVGVGGTVFVSDAELKEVQGYTEFAHVVGDPLSRLKGLLHEHWQRVRGEKPTVG